MKNLYSRLAQLEKEQPPESPPLIVRVGFDGERYFEETKEQALARYGITPNRADTIIYVTYTAE